VDSTLILAILFFITALLYASVGQAGASGYLAAMALLGIGPEVMRPTALVLNVLVATIGTVLWVRAGQFTWSTFWPFTAGSLPHAFLGGAIRLPATVFEPLVGAILLIGAVLLVRPFRGDIAHARTQVPIIPALLSGGVIGLLSGLTATGGAVFLVPLLVLTGWGDVRHAAGVSAAFIPGQFTRGAGGQPDRSASRARRSPVVGSCSRRRRVGGRPIGKSGLASHGAPARARDCPYSCSSEVDRRWLIGRWLPRAAIPDSRLKSISEVC